MAKTETIVFLSLVLDLFGTLFRVRALTRSTSDTAPAAFTIPLPLFPRLIEWYTKVLEFNLRVKRSSERIPPA